MSPEWDGAAFVDQVVFGFGRTTSGREMGVLASSFLPWSDQPIVWHERLKAHYRLSPDQSGATSFLPRHALSYLEFGDGRAAVLRRSHAGDLGRNFSHGLVGYASELSSLSPYLDDWPEWLDGEPAGPLAPVEIAGLATARDTHGYRLDRAALELHERAVPLVAALLSTPRAGVSVLGAPFGAELPLVRLIRGVLGPVFDGADPAFRWTFSTFELDDNRHRPDLPVLVFLPQRPRTETAHIRVNLEDVPDPRSPYTELARALVNGHVECFGRPEQADYIDDLRHHVDGVHTVEKRIARIRQVLLDELIEDEDKTEEIWLGWLTETEPTPPPRSAAEALLHAPLESRRPRSSPAVADDITHTVPAPAVDEDFRRPPAASPRGPGHTDEITLLEQVTNAADGDEMADALRQMRARITTATLKDRAVLQRHLPEIGFLVPAISSIRASQCDTAWAFTTVLEFAYGPGAHGLADGSTIELLAVQLSGPGVDPVLVHVGHELARHNGVAPRLQAGLGQRWLDDHPLPEPLELHLTRSRLPAFVRSAITTMRAYSVHMVILALVVVLSFVAGVLVDRFL